MNEARDCPTQRKKSSREAASHVALPSCFTWASRAARGGSGLQCRQQPGEQSWCRGQQVPAKSLSADWTRGLLGSLPGWHPVILCTLLATSSPSASFRDPGGLQPSPATGHKRRERTGAEQLQAAGSASLGQEPCSSPLPLVTQLFLFPSQGSERHGELS